MIDTVMTEEMKLRKFHAYQARLVKLWAEAGMDVPDGFEGNLVHYAMCEVIDNTEEWELPIRYFGFNTERPDLILKSLSVHNDAGEYAYFGFATAEEAIFANPSAEHQVVTICHCCQALNYLEFN
jgi:hypothetical protein